MRQAITYKLEDGAYQPYIRCLELGLNFEGGLTMKNDVYLGILDGAEDKINEFMGANTFDAKRLTDAEAIAFYSSTIPDNVQDIMTPPTKTEMVDNFINNL